LFDTLGPKTPFYLIGLLDLFFAIGVISFTQCGLFRFYEKKEANSKIKREDFGS